MCSGSSVPCTLKDGQKDIITIESNGRRGNMYHITARIYYSKNNSGSRCGVLCPRIISRQLSTVSCAGTDYIFLQTTHGRIKSSPDQEHPRKSISFRQLTFTMGSLATNLKCGKSYIRKRGARNWWNCYMSSISACRTRESIPSKQAMQESPVPKQRPTVMSSALPIFVTTVGHLLSC